VNPSRRPGALAETESLVRPLSILDAAGSGCRPVSVTHYLLTGRAMSMLAAEDGSLGRPLQERFVDAFRFDKNDPRLAYVVIFKASLPVECGGGRVRTYGFGGLARRVD
jgi:hypothetical protein